MIKSMNPTTGESTDLTTVIDGSEDYCWTPKEEMIMGSGSKLYVFKRGGEWTEFADLASSGITNITRLSVSPDGKKLVVVSD